MAQDHEDGIRTAPPLVSHSGGVRFFCETPTKGNLRLTSTASIGYPSTLLLQGMPSSKSASWRAKRKPEDSLQSSMPPPTSVGKSCGSSSATGTATKAGRRICLETAQSCPQCQLGSDYGHRQKTTGIIQSQGPCDTLSIDIVRPLPSDHRQEFLIVFVDCYSKYTILVPSSNHTANTVSEALLRHVILYFGTPRRLLSDRGIEFISDIWTKLLRSLGIQQILTCKLPDLWYYSLCLKKQLYRVAFTYSSLFYKFPYPPFPFL